MQCEVCGEALFDGDGLCARCRQMLEGLSVISAQLSEPPLSLDTPIVADSLDMAELVAEIEKAYDAQIPPDEIASIKTIRDVLRIIRKYGG
jgi:acyl carrier protein